MSKRNGILATLGLNVHRQREANQFTQEKLAERAGLDATCISGIERGSVGRNRWGEARDEPARERLARTLAPPVNAEVLRVQTRAPSESAFTCGICG